MASKADICNAALNNLGASATVVSIDPPDGSAYSLHCARVYPMALQQILASHPWQFAIERKVLAAVSDGNDQWAYKKALPANCLRPLSLIDSASTSDYDSIPFIIEGTNLFCDSDDVTLIYIVSEVDAGRMTPIFVRALADLIAFMLSGPVMKADANTRNYLRNTADASIRQAAAVDAMSRKQKDPEHTPVWLKNR